MKLPSIEILLKSAINSFVRFWPAIVVSVIGSVISIGLIEHSEDPAQLNLVHCCLLGISGLISLTLFTEYKNFNNTIKLVIQFAGLLLLIAYYFYLPEKAGAVHYYRSVLLFIAFHLIASYISFINKGSINGFWQFNKKLFLDFSLSVVYSGFIFTGLAIAMVASDMLFDIKIDERRYAQLWVVVVGIFNTWFFLSGVPKNIKELDQENDYPIGLKIFTQYVLLPLVTLYLVILYLYAIKIVMQWEMPEGLVTYLVLAFSITGIFSLLLVYPVQNSDKYKWIKVYARWFYWGLFPLIILLFVAIGIRINNYGFTENRYFVLILALWLLGITIFLLQNKLINIKIIPISLSLVALFSAFGPWGAFSVSEYSQFSRLKNILTENKILVNNKLNEQKVNVSFDTQKEISSIVDYLVDVHGVKKFENIGLDKLDTIKSDRYSYSDVKEEIMKKFHMSYYSKWENVPEGVENYYFSVTYANEPFNISGYDYFSHQNYYQNYGDSIEINQSLICKNDTINISYISKTDEFCYIYKTDTLHINIKNFCKNLKEKTGNFTEYSVKPEWMSIVVNSKLLSLKLDVENISASAKSDQTFSVQNFGYRLLIKFNTSEKEK